MTDIWSRRFRVEADVPRVPFPVVPHDHPDLELIRQTYLSEGRAFGVDYGLDEGQSGQRSGQEQARAA